jgi:alanine transaminase
MHLRFCKEEALVLIADEVYQANIYVDDKDFFSFKKVACDMGLLQDVPLVSLHSISKGRCNIAHRPGNNHKLTSYLNSSMCSDAFNAIQLARTGFVGECGRRGGYMEVTGFPADVNQQILKLASINLCPNLSGQICCALMMNPPQEGEPSFALYDQVSSRGRDWTDRGEASLQGFSVGPVSSVLLCQALGAVFVRLPSDLKNGQTVSDSCLTK